MSRSKLILVSDDQLTISKVEHYAQSNDMTFKVFSVAAWDAQNSTPVQNSTPSLVSGNNAVGGGKVLAFPTGGVNGVGNSVQNGKVQTINELEAVAIERAIGEYNGNLTEAAKALGIGRATLYRKVKQYQIDPAKARKSRKLAA